MINICMDLLCPRERFHWNKLISLQNYIVLTALRGTNSLSREHFQDSEGQRVAEVRLKETKPDAIFLWIRRKWNPNLKLLCLNLYPVPCYLQWSAILTHFLFCCLPPLDILCVSHIRDVWLFVLPKHPLGLACMPKPKDACNMLYKSAKTDRIFLSFFFPSPCFRSLQGPPKMSAPNSN